jgi:hypothetical protein
MIHATMDAIKIMAPAWEKLTALTPAKLQAIESERHYRRMVKLMNELLDYIGDDETHSLIGLLDIVTMLVHNYEERVHCSSTI